MPLAAGVDWTQVLILGVPAYIASLGGVVAAIYSLRIRRDVGTPSGDSLGDVAERTHDIAHANAALIMQTNKLVEEIDGHTRPPEPPEIP